MNTYKFGKHPKKQDDRNLMFAKYSAALLPPPESVSNLERVFNNTRISTISKLFPMDGNDSLGDCVMAGAAHMVTGWNGMISRKIIPAKCAVIRQYKKLTGGQDSGLNELDTLNYWRKHSFFGEEILAHVEVDPKNVVHVKQAIQLFGGLYIGMNVQENAISDFNNGITWTPGKPTGDGHCVVVIDYNKDFVTILTWGGKILATWDWFAECVDEAHAILSAEAEINGFTSGYDYAALQADLS